MEEAGVGIFHEAEPKTTAAGPSDAAILAPLLESWSQRPPHWIRDIYRRHNPKAEVIGFGRRGKEHTNQLLTDLGRKSRSKASTFSGRILGYSHGDDRRRLQIFLHSESVIEGEFIIEVLMDYALGRISFNYSPTQCLLYKGVDVVFVLYSNSSKQLNTPYCFFNVWGGTHFGEVLRNL